MYASPGESVTRKLARQILRFLLPASCLACGREVRRVRGSLGLCEICRGRLVRWPAAGCDVCGRPLEGAHLPAGYRCGACRRRPPPYERLICAWTYQSPIDAVLTGLKFRRLEYLGAHLGRSLADFFGRQLDGCDLVAPVPLHWSRYLQRGYNQAGTIARPLAQALGIPCVGLLRRRRPTPPQSRLSRAARRRNPRGAFDVRRAIRCQGKQILLVDDIVTTGATLQAAAACLRQAGVGRVIALAAARTPEP